ncbi:MAG: aminopeptidase P family protein, partial [Myxococcota bacterium]
MIHTSVHQVRRASLQERVDGSILLMGNGERMRNLPMNSVPFRQDSTFLYFTGCTTPDAAALLDDDGYTLFLPTPPEGDELWHGPTPTLEEQRMALGADRVRDSSELGTVIGSRSVKTLAVADNAKNAIGSRITGQPLAFGAEHGHLDLADAVIDMRRRKGAEELEELRRAAAVTTRAFNAVMAATRPGTTERGLAALFQAVLANHGCVPGYGLILSVRGEILHNFHHHNTLEDGQLLLLDGGGEVDTGYTVDITRTWPTNGRYAPRQKSAYQAVLEAQLQAINQCRPGVRYRHVHDTACRVLAQWLIDEGLLLC